MSSANSITWVRIAIDRFTGYMLDKQIDEVNEQRVLRTTTGDSGDQTPRTPKRFPSSPGSLEIRVVRHSANDAWIY